ncbi:MAG TPA: hypothetical protein VKZ41_01180 [Gemmatimonadales bacterium]|nr:hypothetical protein [Gemmatimonadales bacterium]
MPDAVRDRGVASTAALVPAGVLHLLGPKLRTMRNRMRSRSRGSAVRAVVLLVLALSFGGGAFVGLRRVLWHFRTADLDLGPVLAGKLLGMVLLSFLAILLLSNVVAALSTCFLAKDLDLIVGSPHDWKRLYAAKLVETLAHSSWMVALLCVPLFAAYGDVYDGGLWFAPFAVAILLPYFIIPAVVGLAVTLLLVNIAPARRARDILAFVLVLAVGALVLLVRLARPERLIRPEGFTDFMDFVEALSAPSAPWLPSEWAQQALMGWLRWNDQPMSIVALWAMAIAFVVGGALLHRWLYLRGFSRAQEGMRREARSFATTRVPLLLRWLPPLRRELVLKEFRVFARDASQWSQLILLGVLVVVYVFNVKLLPIKDDDGVGWFLRNMVPFFNLALGGFILASIAARFVLPTVSLEGRTWWLLRSSPMDPRELLWAKYWTGAIPLLVLALILAAATNALLGVEPFVFYVSVMTITMLALALPALALCVGTFFPHFESESAAQIPTSFGGLLFMLAAIVLVGVVIVLEARPVFAWLRHQAFGRPLDVPEVVMGFAVAGAVCVAATLLPLMAATRRLRALER